MGDTIINPWYEFSTDLMWVPKNLWLVYRFVVENSVLATSFAANDEVDGIDGRLTEVYVRDPMNWIESAFIVVTTVLGSPLLTFLSTMIVLVDTNFVRELNPYLFATAFILGTIPTVIFFPAVLILSYLEIGLILLYFLLRILQSFELQDQPSSSLQILQARSTNRDPPTNEDDNVKSFFINGICVRAYWARQNSERLQNRLGRQKVGTVTPIVNTSYGAVADLFETIITRNFRVNSTVVGIATKTIKDALVKSRKDGIVRLIAHSQGAIIANLVVQRLYYEFSLKGNEDILKKLHVHTFACASRDFINPEGLLGCLEHFVNQDDPVVKFGIHRSPPTGKYDGNVFINTNGRGHLLNKYYSLDRNSYTPVKPFTNPELLN